MWAERLDTADPVAVFHALAGVNICEGVVVAERLNCPPWMPRRTVKSLFEGVGILRGVCATLGLRLELVTPQTWQRFHFGRPPPRHRKSGPEHGASRKKSFVLAARERWPDGDFPMAWGMADAAWIAEYARRRAKVPA